MIAADKHVNEEARLKELDSFAILDTLSESDYDQLTAIAAGICGTKISLISLLDENRQWFKSRHGLNVTETPKDYAFCAHAINDQDQVFIVNDATKDERFHDNPLVTNDPKVVFYAGVPLLTENSLPLGTLCVIDDKPKTLSESQLTSLKALGNQVMNLLNLRKAKATLEATLEDLEEKNLELERFAYTAAHDLKSPLLNIDALTELLIESKTDQLDDEGKMMLSLIGKSSSKLKTLIDGLLEISSSKNVQNEKKSTIYLNGFINDLMNLLSYQDKLTLKKNFLINDVTANAAALEQTFLNLIVNAIKYNDKETIELEIGASATDTHYEFYIQDNGPGITSENQKKIFNIYEVSTKKDRYGKSGNGIGLATVKKVVESCGGTIKVISKPDEGAKFIFTLKK